MKRIDVYYKYDDVEVISIPEIKMCSLARIKKVLVLVKDVEDAKAIAYHHSKEAIEWVENMIELSKEK